MRTWSRAGSSLPPVTRRQGQGEGLSPSGAPPASPGSFVGLHALVEASWSPALCSNSFPGRKEHEGLWEPSRVLEPLRLEVLGHLLLLWVGKLRLHKPKSCAQSHRASRCQSPAWNAGVCPWLRTAPPALEDVFVQGGGSWGPGSHPGPRVCWGGNSKRLHSPGEVTRMDSGTLTFHNKPLR